MSQKYLYIAAIAVLLALATFVGLYLRIQFETRQYIYSSVESAPTTQVALVLGASVMRNGTLSPVLEERVDKAVELYRMHKVSKILMTGDNSTIAHNEVEPVRRYLLAADVRPEDIFLDHAGFDTYSSMYRARDVFAVTSVTIVTQPFHLPRAVYIARELGLNAVGIEAGEPGKYLYNYAREAPASIKAELDLLFYRIPKYLGPQFPITGTGTTTWE
ncbi:MAG TPA: ElyC/SanA/YdcF family protein [Candidatus Paceibacterota bacterium]|nr:ElyC/SanA/YdcF family protein [Candidatus Paceibacterota bacterium]